MQGLGYIPISPAHPQKENRLILKGWGVKLRVLGWVFWGLPPNKKVGNYNPAIPSKICGLEIYN